MERALKSPSLSLQKGFIRQSKRKRYSSTAHTTTIEATQHAMYVGIETSSGCGVGEVLQMVIQLLT